MALVTLCPGCGTTFRVNAVQLQAHSGEVRCGRCHRLFNGFATLITVNESEIEYPTRSHEQPQHQSAAHSVHEKASSTESLAGMSHTNDEPGPKSDPDWNQKDIEDVDHFEISKTFFDEEKTIDSSRSRWALASVFLLLLLMWQIAHSYRTELTIIAPASRPYLERYCAMMACTVPYPQDINLLGIESSELQKKPARQGEVTTLIATLRNHASFPQVLPDIQLSLLDAQNQLIASRIFTPQDYLQADNATLAFFESMHEIEIKLDFDSSNLNALGYRLQLLYL
ncbi:MAG: zinc-ribbon and DUF3426 domain-containing protein [Nitrosomonas sp.]|jgi:predicted Zn finger-like uncharacterized protein|nr:zinc-ribbon and DUF3426 domain-containing protein [Nitrosomonas sp.]MBP7112339.1 zinc-ribbon and DUF3426 domain-containing protein [Nitrosomonas sp.]